MNGDEAEPPEFKPSSYRAKPAFDFEQIRSLVQRHFKVYEVEANVGGPPGSEISAFYVQADAAEFNEKFEALRASVRDVDPNLMVILQYRMGEDVILIARKPPVTTRGAGLNLILFIATILTTTLAGSIFYAGYVGAEDELLWGGVDVTYLLPRFLALGFLSFSLPVMLILGIHELGHYFIAKRHHVRTSLPFFIPVPPIVPIGTFGAFISIREPIPDRKALFDIGAAGPIAGFIASLPVIVIGLLLTTAVGAKVPVADEVHADLRAPDGTLWGFGHNATDAQYVVTGIDPGDRDLHEERIVVNHTSAHFSPGEWIFWVRGHHLDDPAKVTMRITYSVAGNHTPSPPFQAVDGNFSVETVRELLTADSREGIFQFNLPANATSLTVQFSWKPPAPGLMHLGTSILFEGFSRLFPTPADVLIHPTGFAGWVGLLVTGFNLLPAGQLDGGHVARAVLGNNMKYASYASIAGMFALSFFFTGWLVMAILIVFLGIRHPPPLNDKTTLDGRRKALAVVVLLILIVSFIPIPFSP